MTSLGYKEVTRSTARAHLDGDRKYAQSLQASGASLEKALAHSTTLTVDQLEEVLPPAPRLPEEDDDFGEGDDAPAQKRSRTEDWEMTVDKGDGRDDDDSAGKLAKLATLASRSTC